jgi:hypothetical protein
MPVWTWDTDHYGEDNKDMIGKFYTEDYENIKQLDYFTMEFNIRMAKKQPK